MMDKQQAKKEIERLTTLVAYHNKLYYEEARPEISDYEFDQLLEKLIALENQFPDLRLPNSPTQHIGGEASKNFATVYHQYPMLSLSNTYSAEEVGQFVKRIQKQLPGATIEFFCELKFDGVAISLLYKKGKLDRVITRGDGVKGDDITENAKQIPNIPQVIEHKDLPPAFEVRGEAFMSLADFEKLNKDRLLHGLEPLANPRNATAGTLKTLKNTGPKRSLDCYMYSLLSTDIDLPTHEVCIQWIEKWGFHVSPTYKKCRTLAEVMAYIEYWESAKSSLPVAIDGVVIKVNDTLQQNKLGLTAKSPRWAIAYKYKPENVATILESVDYQVGRTGVITPVAHLKPILLAGTIVKRATLYNAGEIQRLGLHLGDTVFIEKGGEIIPKITGTDVSKRSLDSEPVKFVTHCPACGTELVKRYEKALYYCPNTKGCPYQLQGLLKHFVHRKAMDIRSIGKQTIEMLINRGLVHTPADLYSLKYQDIRSLEGFKDLATRNVLSGIESSKQRPFERVLFALGIRHVGEVIADKITQYYTDIDTLSNATVEDLIAIPFIGTEIAHSVTNYFENPENLALIDALKQAGLQLSRPQLATVSVTQSLPLSGKTFVISGTFQRFEREALKELIKKKGGGILTNISAKLNYLIIGENPGPSKVAQAQALGISTINETEILQMLEL
ncbi:MAG: NAD-dependent DNA ligase LigA [Candidatus Amoebophilus sp.]